jgi:hypothetical protein
MARRSEQLEVESVCSERWWIRTSLTTLDKSICDA